MGEPPLSYSAPPGRESFFFFALQSPGVRVHLLHNAMSHCSSATFARTQNMIVKAETEKSARPPINMMAGVHLRIVQFCAENNKRESKGAAATAPGDKVKCLRDENISQIFILICFPG